MRICCLFLWLISSFAIAGQNSPTVIHSEAGDFAINKERGVKIVNIHKMQQYRDGGERWLDIDIISPKSAAYHPDGSKLYINSLEGFRTVVYDAKTLEKVTVINHIFENGNSSLWTNSRYYPWNHYPDGESKPFRGKPVEMAFSHDGRYLWIPYYRRSFDINAQDPSAVAVIDTYNDSIIRMFDTGSLPKMVAVSNDGNLLAVTHWGENTVGLFDISSSNPTEWESLEPIIIGKKLVLNYALDKSVNRDTDSGYMLRGTVFIPGDRYLLIGCMAGGIAVVDLKENKHTGFINDVSNVRHLTISGNNLYVSCNIDGKIFKIPIENILDAISLSKISGTKDIKASGWQSCNVGKGARTIEVTPDGKYIFVACNFSNRLDVVDSESMELVVSIRCDSYPVGLCISPTGHHIAVTSQGRNREGGNAVNIFEFEYETTDSVQ